MTKKEKIILESTDYFNQHGYGESSLQDLANALNMSRGNLAYHFSSKEDLLEAISDKMWAEIAEIRVPTKQLPSFENVQNEIQLFYNIQQKYAFVFGDMRILKHPLLIDKLYTSYQKMKSNAQEAIAFSIQLGNMRVEPFPGVYNNIIDAVWGFALFWPAMQHIKKRTITEDATKMMWSLIIPHFTEKGIKAFKAFYGDTYLDNLGHQFDLQLKDFTLL